MMTPNQAFEAIKPASEIAVDLAVVAGLKHLRASGYGKPDAEAVMDEMLRRISDAIPETIREISNHGLSIAVSEHEGDLPTQEAYQSLSAMAHASFAYLGVEVAERLVASRAKGGAA